MRKKKHPEHVNQERWLVSYADFITLLFAFFTTMYAISTVDAQKMGRMVLSMRASFSGVMFPTGSDTLSLSSGQGSAAALGQDLVENVNMPKEKALKEFSIQGLDDLNVNFVPTSLPHAEVIALTRLRQDVEGLISKKKMTSKVRTWLEERGLVISLGEGGFFDSGSDELKPDGKELLNALAQQLRAMENQIRIEGHTDNVPIQTVRFPSNWELSTARASTIIRHLERYFGFTGKQLSASGYGEFHPIATNDTVEGRARNRRVDIVVMNSKFAMGEPK